GRAVYATGSDFEAARLAGLRPRWVTFSVFALLGGLVGLAAALEAVRKAQLGPKVGDGLEMRVIAAAVVGGVAISGGRGRLIGTNFLSKRNRMETLRLSVEIGLLAVALTPVIVTGGIDLSVGSLMGLSAVLLGKLWRDGHLPIGVAAVAVIGIGLAAGALNG